MSTPPFSLSEKVAVVTGGASGIGAGIAETLAEAGAVVVIADRDAPAAAATAGALSGKGLRVEAVGMDVADERSVVAACREIVARHGAPWALINNAGIQDRQFLLEETAEAWDRIQAVNARGAFLVTRELGREMARGGAGGRIVNVASGVLAGMLAKGAAAYVASKGALAAFSSITALELVEHGVTVNTVLPGAVPTPGVLGAKGPPTSGPGTRRAPLGLCEPRDIGAAVLFFAGPGAGRITDQVVAVDAGWSLS